MGTGKGDVDDWVVVVKPGTILYEIDAAAGAGSYARFEREHCAEGFHAAEGLVGFGFLGLEIIGAVDGGFLSMVAEVVEGEIADGAEEPGSRVGDLLPVGVEFEECFLNEVLGRIAVVAEDARQPHQ